MNCTSGRGINPYPLHNKALPAPAGSSPPQPVELGESAIIGSDGFQPALNFALNVVLKLYPGYRINNAIARMTLDYVTELREKGDLNFVDKR